MFCIVENCRLKKCKESSDFCKKHCGETTHDHCENTWCFKQKKGGCCFYHCTKKECNHCVKPGCSLVKCKNSKNFCGFHCESKKCTHCISKKCKNKKERNNLCLNCYQYIFGCFKCETHKVFKNNLCVLCFYNIVN